jgi:Tfp pilus assembly protein FimT
MTRTALWRRASTASSGFQLVELLVLLGVVGIITAIGAPMYLSYYRAQQTEGAARTIVTALHQARQLAITRGITYTVETQTNPNNRMRFTCAAGPLCPTPVFVGPGTDGSGWRTLENASRIVQGPTITFTSLGAATVAPGGTPFRVQNSTATGSLDVCVSPSGRIRVQAQGAACP